MLLFLIFVKLGVKLVVANNVEGNPKGVVGFSSHLSKIETGDGNCMVDNDLIVVPPRMTTHTAIKALDVFLVRIVFPCFFFLNQTACLTSVFPKKTAYSLEKTDHAR